MIHLPAHPAQEKETENMPARKSEKNTEPAEPAKDDTKAADAAVAEATGDDTSIVIPFRGAEFKVEREVLSSARLLVAIAQGLNHKILVELLAPADVDRFVGLLKRGEHIAGVAAEFLGALNEAAGLGGDQGNS